MTYFSIRLVGETEPLWSIETPNPDDAWWGFLEFVGLGDPRQFELKWEGEEIAFAPRLIV